jgi:hypothetical protein
MKTTTPLRPHKVLGKTSESGELHALCFTTGDFADIIFSYTNVKFEEDEDNDRLTIKYSYDVHEIPDGKQNYDVKTFEQELGDFIMALLYYGIERDQLGYIDDQQAREDNPFQSNPQ